MVRKTVLLFGILLGMILLAEVAGAQLPAEKAGIGTLIVKTGPVYIVRSGLEDKDKVKAQKGDLLYPGDRLKVGELGRAALLLNDGSVIRLKENTEMVLAEEKQPKNMNRLKLLLGQLWAKIKKQDSSLEIETPSAIAAIKGTELELIAYANGQVDLIVWDGMVEFFNQLGKVMVYAAQQSSAPKGGKPSAPKSIQLEQQDQWFESVVDIPESKTLKLKVKDQDGQDQNLQLRYKKK